MKKQKNIRTKLVYITFPIQKQENKKQKGNLRRNNPSDTNSGMACT